MGTNKAFVNPAGVSHPSW